MGFNHLSNCLQITLIIKCVKDIIILPKTSIPKNEYNKKTKLLVLV